MEYEIIINLLGNTPNQPSKFSTKIWIEINDDSRGTYNTNSQIKFKTAILKSSLGDYSDAYILVKKRVTITGRGADQAARQADERDEEVIFKNCAPFIRCISEINNTQVYNSNDLGVVMPINDLIENTVNYSKNQEL